MAASGQKVEEDIRKVPGYLSHAFEESAKRGFDLSNRPYQAYPENRVAHISDPMQQAMDMARNTGSYAPMLAGASRYADRSMERLPQGYQAYLDPNQDALLQSISRQGQRAFKEKVMPELDARFLRLGQHGGSRHARLSGQAARDVQREISNQQEDVMSRGYQGVMQGFDVDRLRSLANAENLQSLGLLRQAGHGQDINALRDTGRIEQDQQQAMLNHAYEQWKDEQRHPYDKMKEYLAILQGVSFIPDVFQKVDITHPRYTMHRQDWKNLGLNALADFGTEKLKQHFNFASGGSVHAPYMRGME
jgi:hypothetical protein